MTKCLKALHFSYFITATSSLLTVTTLSVDRYVAIMYPSKYKRWFTLRACVSVSVCIWSVSLLTSFVYFTLGYIHCLMLFTHVTMVAGITVITVSLRTSNRLKQQAQRMLKSKSVCAPRQSVAVYDLEELHFERKITREFLVIMSTFLVIYMPTFLLTYVLHFCHVCGCLVHHVIRDVTFLLVCCNSVVNPFVYALRVKAVRKALLLMMRWKSTTEATNSNSNSNARTFVISTSM